MKYYRFYWDNGCAFEYGPTTRETVERYIKNPFLLTQKELGPFPLPHPGDRLIAIEELNEN